jgi:hypothetical protein
MLGYLVAYWLLASLLPLSKAFHHIHAHFTDTTYAYYTFTNWCWISTGATQIIIIFFLAKVRHSACSVFTVPSSFLDVPHLFCLSDYGATCFTCKNHMALCNSMFGHVSSRPIIFNLVVQWYDMLTVSSHGCVTTACYMVKCSYAISHDSCCEFIKISNIKGSFWKLWKRGPQDRNFFSSFF